MCNSACIKFCVDRLINLDLTNFSILEVGSRNVNGSVSFDLRNKNPKKYIGVDMEPGPCVDQVCNVYDIVNVFGKESFNIVISTEMMEHVEDWRLAINNIKDVCKPGGLIFITTRSKGFPLHGYPHDYWRFEVEDMRKIFSDCMTIVQNDPIDIGVFLCAIKPKENYVQTDLSDIRLYDIRG